ncbi:hypothetical protein NLX67_22495 [Domibacillus sp. A3M-37]|uniref:hypothetical protein n=1 Tax=Domibacillus sp. A3M-37 TaxID=2962037 RepID=UPI0020B65B96|nr:hypothetical protein [Domibacillus sp. A3M-37]MCP3765075.1 hypothetical protein [Domibacillus sp. A3M-37]
MEPIDAQELNFISYCYKERIYAALGFKSIEGSNGQFIILILRQQPTDLKSRDS